MRKSRVRVVVSIGCCLVAAPALAQKKPSAAAAYANVVECLKQNGGTYDPETKKWNFRTSEAGVMAKSDAIRECVARNTGIPRGTIPVPETMKML